MSLLESIRSAIKRAIPAVPESIEQEEKAGICHACKQPRRPGETISRGLHERCYKRIKRAMQSGSVNEAYLISQGRIAPRKPSGRKLGDDELAKVIAQLESEGSIGDGK